MSCYQTCAVAALLAVIAAQSSCMSCMSCTRHDDTQTSETHTTGGEMTGWTKVTVAPPTGNDAVRPTPEERAADATELSEPEELAAPAEETTAEETTAEETTAVKSLEKPLPDWVPESGRLTIVGASDLARNLGIVDELDDAGAGP